MPIKQGAYPAEYRQQIVELANAGRSHSDLAREFGCHATSIGTWVRQSRIDAAGDVSADAPLTTAERQRWRVGHRLGDVGTRHPDAVRVGGRPTRARGPAPASAAGMAASPRRRLRAVPWWSPSASQDKSPSGPSSRCVCAPASTWKIRCHMVMGQTRRARYRGEATRY